jgi:hypothetical protein
LVTQLDYASGIASKSRGIVLLSFALAVSYYVTLLSVGSPSFFAPAPAGLTFNSMLLHMLHGSFDVDPETIGIDGVVRNGLTYAYFGVLPALLRLPFVFSPDFATTDFTRLSCVVAVSLMAGFKLASLLTVWRVACRPDRSNLVALFAIALLFGGAQIQFLRVVLYQEVLLWADALASAFIYLILRGYYSERGFSGGRLAALAAIAGLCLLTRVSTALGLYVALGLLMLQLAWQELRAGGFSRLLTRMLMPILSAGAILLAFIAVAAVVNYGRWGNPLVFAGDAQSHALAGPDLSVYDARYGWFNPIRVGYSLAYYFIPVWVLRGADGNLLWSAFQERTIGTVELPPSSFFLSDPLIIGLMIFALIGLVARRNVLDRAIAVPVLAGLFVPIALILTFNCMTFRYRLEFYPFFDLCAFLGFGALLSRPKDPPVGLFAIPVFCGVAASHAIWLLYMLSPMGNAAMRMGGMDVISFYLSERH